jgi:hypothetical protein
MNDQWGKVRSLYVDYDVSGQPVGDPANVKRYLLLDFFVTQHKSFAFKGQLRFSRSLGPGSAEVIAPGVEPDWDAIPGGKEMKARQDQRRAEDEKNFGKERVEKAMKEAAAETRRSIPAEMVAAFDGKVFRVSMEKGVFQVWTPENIGNDSGWFHPEYMRNIGRMLPNVVKGDDAAIVDRFPESFLANRGFKVEAALEEVDGCRCAVVARGKEEKLWLDPATNYGVRRREFYDPKSGLPSDIFRNQDFAEVVPGVWLPKAGTWDRCAPPGAPPAIQGKPLARYQLTVSKVSVNDVPDDLFSLKIAPGATVVDTSVLPPKNGEVRSVSYPMPADGSQLDATIQQAIQEKERFESRAFSTMTIIWINAGIVLLAVVAFVVYRMRRKRAA